MASSTYVTCERKQFANDSPFLAILRSHTVILSPTNHFSFSQLLPQICHLMMIASANGDLPKPNPFFFLDGHLSPVHFQSFVTFHHAASHFCNPSDPTFDDSRREPVTNGAYDCMGTYAMCGLCLIVVVQCSISELPKLSHYFRCTCSACQRHLQ